MPEFAAPLFEYRLHPPKKKGPPPRNAIIPGGPPLVFRFCKDGTAQVGIHPEMHTIRGARLAELLELVADHMRGPTTSAPDRVRATLIRMQSGNPDSEEYSDLELR